ncbi:Lrp/AsnC family transcriptional regulator [Vreelandella subglaciescola]|uniref:siroheme decarboxylase n=1 Tax=Vreelandella subglaciescola TaxID=29571 RepID=A0A1M7I340_9GAMM|nr:Lrp/AsnC family transcriptional regulator [Halomonas subglaciescola]SHM34837.1 transcriptional regulator, AsnC family [Halomonas subglaciescola]
MPNQMHHQTRHLDPLDPRELDALDRRLLDTCQRGMPVEPKPFLTLAQRLNTTESDILDRLARLHAVGVISRAGPVFDHARAGASLLAAVAAQKAECDAVAAEINRAPGINHNYLRDAACGYNLWFVMTAPDEAELDARLAALEVRLDRAVLRLPMLESFHIDLAFPLPWDELDKTELDKNELDAEACL